MGGKEQKGKKKKFLIRWRGKNGSEKVISAPELGERVEMSKDGDGV